MTAFSFQDMSLLPAPDVIEKIDYEVLFGTRKNALNARNPLSLNDHYTAAIKAAEVVKAPNNELFWKIPVDNNAGLFYLDLESDPMPRLLQEDSYREMILRQRINDAAHAVMPAYSTGTDLDNLAAGYGVSRLVIEPEIRDIYPPKPAVLESDDALRKRMILSIEARTTAGSHGSYLYHVMTASGKIKDAQVVSPNPCDIVISVLSHDGNGTTSEELLETVREAVDDKFVRPMGDRVLVVSAEVIEYEMDATLYFYNGPDRKQPLQLAHDNFDYFRVQSERIGHYVTDSGVKDALHTPGVYRAIVNTPDLPLVIDTHQAPYCKKYTIHDGGVVDV
jgi:phage-related baseplate assembly protein